MQQDSALFRISPWLWVALFLSPFFILWKGIFFVLAVLVLCAVWALSYRLDIGWYVLVFLSPMWHLTIRFADYWYLFQEYPQLLGIYGPAVDFWAVLLLAAFMLNRVRAYFDGGKAAVRLPLIGVYLLFFMSALLSLWYVPYEYVNDTIKFIVRFVLFFYVGFVVLGVNIVSSKEILRRSLLAFGISGLLGAIMGFISLPLGVWQGGVIPRAVPFAIGRWMPFGDQHIFLGEAITATVPIWLYFWYTERNSEKRSLYRGIAIFMLVIGFLTFSRAAWIAFLLGAALLLWLLREEVSFKALFQSTWWFVAGVLALFPLFFAFLSTTYNVTSSTTHRYYLFEIAMYLFWQHPLVGNGVGMYPWLSSELNFFQWEIGGLQESHGWIQQLLSEQGALGLFFFLLFFLYFFVFLIRRYKQHHYTKDAQQMALLGIFMVALPLTFQLFSTHLYTSKLWVPVALAMAGYVVYAHDRHYANTSVGFIKKNTLFNI